METQIAVSVPDATYSLHSATRGLPSDVSRTMFLRLVDHCRLASKAITRRKLQELIECARLVQKLPAEKQQLLLSRAADSEWDRAKAILGLAPVTLDPQDKEAWIKERVSDAYSWVRDLRKLGIASASSYIFAGRRSASQPPRDWANDVLYYHYCQELTVQDAVSKYVDGLDNAFLQLPDRRWYIKCRGEAVPPLADNLGGLRYIHALINHNHLGSVVVREKRTKPSCVFMPPSSALSDEQQGRTLSRMRESAELKSRSVKSYAAVRGNQTQDSGRDPQRVIDSEPTLKPRLCLGQSQK